jgi:hypothetical protein
MTLIRLRLLSRPSTKNRRQKRVRCYVNWTMRGTAPCLLTRIRHALRHPVSAFDGPGPMRTGALSDDQSVTPNYQRSIVPNTWSQSVVLTP